MLAEFGDAAGGGLYTTAAHVHDVPVRAKESYDGAIPSGNGAAAWVLARLARLTGDVMFEERALEIMRAFLPMAERASSGFAVMLMAVDLLAGPSQEIVLVAPDAADLAPHIETLHRTWQPHAVRLVRTDANAAELAALAPFTASMHALDGVPTRYVCENHACSLPERLADASVSGVADLQTLLRQGGDHAADAYLFSCTSVQSSNRLQAHCPRIGQWALCNNCRLRRIFAFFSFWHSC
jgi:uncharacterized protein YyaL (SSP411 family)